MNETHSRHWADTIFGHLPSDSKEVNLLALACALVMGNPEVAHRYYKTARRAGASDAALQNVTTLASQAVDADLSLLAFETVWQASDSTSAG